MYCGGSRSGCSSSASRWTYSVPSPSEADVETDVKARLDEVLRSGRAPGLHGLVVLRDGRPILEHYESGEDFAWNEPLGPITFGPDVLHDVRSVTKSIVGLLYGIALA